MKDYLGNELETGDTVAYIDTHYKCLKTGIIIALGDKQATIRNPSYSSDSRYYDSMGCGKTCRYYNCIIKIR